MADEISKDAVILRPQEVNTKLESYKGKAHLLTPYARTKFDNIMQGFVPVIRETYIDPDPKGGKEVYNSQEGHGMLALTKIALQKLAKLAGVKWVYTRRVDGRVHPHIAAYVAKGTMRDVDGNTIEETKTGDIDLRDGTPQALEKTADQLKMARRHIAALAETKAMDRVIRALLGTRSYTAAELQKPFIILKLALDPNDDRVSRMLQEEEVGISKALGFQAPEDDPEGEDLSDLPPAGTQGLDIGPIPGDKPRSSPPQGTGPIIDVAAESVRDVDPSIDHRQAIIHHCEDLYYMTGLTRAADKPPIDSLSDEDLGKLERALLTKPIIRQLPGSQGDGEGLI